MKIVDALPPNIKAIEERLGPHTPGVVYAYGDTIYAPGLPEGYQLPDHLIAHEEEHQKQHGGDPKSWWAEYLAAPWFRLDQEVRAYRAQYAFLTEHYGRPERRRILKAIVKDLSGPVYGNLVDGPTARALIQGKMEAHECALG